MRKKITLVLLCLILAGLIVGIIISTSQGNNYYVNLASKSSKTAKAAKLLEKNGGSAQWDRKSKTLTICDIDFTATGSDALILPKDSTLILQGENTIRGEARNGGDAYGIHALGNLTIQGEGSLTVERAESTGGTSTAMQVVGGDLCVESGTLLLAGQQYGLRVSEGTLILSEGATLIAEGKIQAVSADALNLPDQEEPALENVKQITLP